MTQLKQTYIHTVVIKDTVEEGLMDNVLKKKASVLMEGPEGCAHNLSLLL